METVKRSWKSIQNKTERFSNKGFFDAIALMREVKSKIPREKIMALGYNKHTVGGWYSGKTIPRDETLAVLRGMLNDTP
jgi:hypothetical protein